jgi:hypothetical protein
MHRIIKAPEGRKTFNQLMLDEEFLSPLRGLD